MLALLNSHVRDMQTIRIRQHIHTHISSCIMQFFIFSASLQQSFQLKYGTIHFMWHDVATSKKKVLQNNEIAIDSELSEASVNDNGHETRGEK